MAANKTPMTFADAAPLLRPLALLLGLAGAIAIGIALFSWARGSVYVPLYSGLNEKSTADVLAALDGASVPYKMGPAVGQIRVPEQRASDARFALAAQGLPTRSENGMEFMKEGTGLGVSQFIENARYQHALETELARSISSIRQVSGARVHLAVPKASAFARDQRQASASVMLEVFPGATIDDAQVQAIINLVASAIPSLEPSKVSVIDQTGRLLSSRKSEDPGLEAAANQFTVARKLEETLAQRVSNILLPLTGPGRLSVEVHADMDFTQTEEASETYRPEPRAIRSEQISESSGGAGQASGVPGAVSNQPKGSGKSELSEADAAALGNVGSRSSTQSRNFEIDRAVSYTRQQTGQLERLTVAVLIDNLPRLNAEGQTVDQPLNEQELERITELVRNAVGYKEARGDSVTVLNASFMPSVEMEPIAPLPLWKQAWVRDFARNAVGVIALLALVFGVMRPAARQLISAPVFASSGPALSAISAPRDVADEQEMARRAGDDPAPPPQREAVPYEQRLQVTRDLIRDDPKRVAQVVRNWVGNDG